MALDATSTLTDAVNQYRDSSDYLTADSLAKAADFIQACIFILEAKPTRDEIDGMRLQIDLGVIERRLEAAQDWWSSHPDNTAAGQGTTHADLTGYRT